MTAVLAAARVGAFVRRDWTIARSYRFPFLLGLIGSFIMLVVLHQVGELVDRSPETTGVLSKGYFSFVLVGMAILGIVHTALQAFANKLREEQTTGTLEALLATPAPVSLVILGSSAYDLLQALGSGLLLMAIGVASGAHIVLAPSSLLAAFIDLAGLMGIFAALGVSLAAFTVVFKRGSSLSALITGGLAVVGGVYFPVNLLPPVVRFCAEILPFTWGVTVMRQALLLGQVDVARTLGVVASAIVLLPLSLLLFRIAVARARQEGSLAQY